VRLGVASVARRTWMQTVGAALLAAKRRSLARVAMAAHDGRRAHGLLCLAAVRDDRRGPEHDLDRDDIDSTYHLIRS